MSTEPADAAGRLAETLWEEGVCLSLREMAISGQDLQRLGYRAGPALGAALNRLFDAVLEEQLPNERAALEARASAWLRESEGG